MKTFNIFNYPIFSHSLFQIDLQGGKKLIQTINAYSYVMAERTPEFKKALQNAYMIKLNFFEK